jgi:hypothetical protein
MKPTEKLAKPKYFNWRLKMHMLFVQPKRANHL